MMDLNLALVLIVGLVVVTNGDPGSSDVGGVAGDHEPDLNNFPIKYNKPGLKKFATSDDEPEFDNDHAFDQGRRHYQYGYRYRRPGPVYYRYRRPVNLHIRVP